MSFWESATTEQKLAQIDGGIECGMTTEQIAVNCGVSPTDKNPASRVVAWFAINHGRKFGYNLPVRRLKERMAHTRTKIEIEMTHDLPDDAFSIFEAAQ